MRQHLAPLLALIAVASLPACGRTGHAATGSQTPAATAGGTPGASGLSPDAILGTWRGTGSPTDCPFTELVITRSLFTRVQNGVAYQAPVLGIDWQSAERNEISVTAGDITTYQFSDSNDMQLETAYGKCPYVRAS